MRDSGGKIIVSYSRKDGIDMDFPSLTPPCACKSRYCHASGPHAIQWLEFCGAANDFQSAGYGRIGPIYMPYAQVVLSVSELLDHDRLLSRLRIWRIERRMGKDQSR